jgi:hypothetical protein
LVPEAWEFRCDGDWKLEDPTPTILKLMGRLVIVGICYSNKDE